VTKNYDFYYQDPTPDQAAVMMNTRTVFGSKVNPVIRIESAMANEVRREATEAPSTPTSQKLSNPPPSPPCYEAFSFDSHLQKPLRFSLETLRAAQKKEDGDRFAQNTPPTQRRLFPESMQSALGLSLGPDVGGAGGGAGDQHESFSGGRAISQSASRQILPRESVQGFWPNASKLHKMPLKKFEKE
jgi:hypothetical protein